MCLHAFLSFVWFVHHFSCVWSLFGPVFLIFLLRISKMCLKFFSKINFFILFFASFLSLNSIPFAWSLLLHFDGYANVNVNEQNAFNVTSLLLAKCFYSNAENVQQSFGPNTHITHLHTLAFTHNTS